MYCANCGLKNEGAASRCPACRHYSLTFWLQVITVVAWLAIGAINYVVFVKFMPILAMLWVGLPVVIPPLARLNLLWSNLVSTWGILIGILLLAIIPPATRAFGRLPRFGRAMTAISLVLFVSVTAIIAAAGGYWGSLDLEGKLMNSMNQTDLQSTDLQARNSARSLMIAEYRYRDLHPKVGFTCDLESLAPLGGPVGSETPDRRPKEPNTVRINIYKLALRGCQGTPVTKYEVSMVRDPEYGTLYEKAPAYCFDGSGVLFSAADGKSETCLTARQPVQ
jgi:hypothetical protein